jgi:hypothetical protein
MVLRLRLSFKAEDPLTSNKFRVLRALSDLFGYCPDQARLYANEISLHS